MTRKYYKVEAKCGHVGRGRCVWVTFATMAENGKEAAKRVRGLGRVKHDHRDAIRSVTEIDFEEFIVLRAANDMDPYLHCKNIQEQRNIPDFEARIVEDRAELRADKKANKAFRRKLLELTLGEFDTALKNYRKEGECA